MSVRSRATAALGLAVAVTGVQSIVRPPAQAVSAGLVISEVYGGGGNAGSTFTNDFIELYNPTASDVPVDGMSVQWRGAAGAAAATGVTPLEGSVPAGGYYLVQEAQGAGGTDALPRPDAFGTIAMGATNGTAMLVSGTTAVNPGVGSFTQSSPVIDLVGVNSNVFETAAAPAMSNASSVLRTGADSDNNSANFTAGGPTPQGSIPPVLAATSPGSRSGNVGIAITPFSLAATSGEAPYTWLATGTPEGITVAPDGLVSGTPTTTGESIVTATVTDDIGVVDDVTFTFTVAPAPAPSTIAEIQGAGATSPVAGQTVTTQGRVTAAYPTGGLQGFYLQTAGTGGAQDATPGSSDGIFAFTPSVPAVGYPEIGASLELSGAVSEFSGSTQITAIGDNIALVADLPVVTPLSATYPTTETAREAHEGELLDPTDDFAVTNTFATNAFAEIGLATGDMPLVQPTDVVDFQTGDPGRITADNLARGVVLDDGASISFAPSGNTLGGAKNIPLPWLSTDNVVRVGGAATLVAPVVLTYGFGVWRFQPTSQVTDEGTDVATFENTRTASPTEVGGNIKLATFNVLNYFPTTGADYEAASLGSCTYFNDREGNPITNNSCTNNGPRGAATRASLERQQAKIVSAISALDASVVSLEEIENSVQFGKDRDFAVAALVDAMNADAGADVWQFVPSPAAADLPSPAQEDVIRTAFIYKSDDVTPVGVSDVLKDEINFDNAREPLAQAFKAKDAADSDAFGVIVNHFKSKGRPPMTGPNADAGQGGFNADRIGQAAALSSFADAFLTERGIAPLFLVGDFNSYTQEDPLQELYADGYTNLESDTEGEVTYSFSGLSGSLDHVLANNAAEALVTGVDIWNINSPESIAYEYSRFNNNVTNFYQDGPYKASDHDPEIVGLNVGGAGTPSIPATPTPPPVTPKPEVSSKVKGKVVVGRTRAFLVVKIRTTSGAKATGQVKVRIKGQKNKTVTIKNGKVKLRLGVYRSAGKKKVVLVYLGNATTPRSKEKVFVQVVRR